MSHIEIVPRGDPNQGPLTAVVTSECFYYYAIGCPGMRNRGQQQEEAVVEEEVAKILNRRSTRILNGLGDICA